MAAERELSLGVRLEHLQATLLERGGVGADAGLLGDLRQGRAAPQRKRLARALSRHLCLATLKSRGRIPRQLRELFVVKAVSVANQPVAAWCRRDDLLFGTRGSERGSDTRHVRLDALRGAAGRV